MNSYREDLAYRKINRLAAALMASVSIILLMVVIVAIIQNGQLRQARRRIDSLERAARQTDELGQRIAILEESVADMERARPAQPPRPLPQEASTATNQPVATESGDQRRDSLAVLAAKLRELSRQSIGEISEALRREVAAALTELESRRVAPGQCPADALAAAASLHLAVGNSEAAVRWGLRAVHEGAAGPSVSFTLARAYQRLGDLEAALPYAVEAASAESVDPKALLLRGMIELALDQAEQAEATLQQAVVHDEVAAEAAAALVDLLMQRGQLDEVLTVLRLGEAAAPGRADLVRRRALLHLARGEHKDCARAAATLLREKPEDAEMVRVFGQALLASGKASAAVQAFRTLVSLEPDQTAGYDLLGLALLAQLKPLEAFAQFSQAAQLDAESPVAWYHLGVALANSDDCDGAIVALDTAIGLDDRQANAHFARAVCLARAGNVAEAEKALVRALALDESLMNEAQQVGVFAGFLGGG